MRLKKTGKRLLLACFIPLTSNAPLWVYGLYTGRLAGHTPLSSIVTLVIIILALVIGWSYFNIMPYRDENRMTLRLLVMRGGHTLGYCGIYGLAVQAGICLFLYPILAKGVSAYPAGLLIGNGIFGLCLLLLLLWNGILRMFLTSSRLRLRTRVLMLLAMWVPVLNLMVLLHAMRLVRAEYDFACYKESVRSVRAESELCKTQYPLIMVHGVGFRDLTYFNYWGRVPRELTRYGATVYYGNQEAFGTIVYNAEDIKKKILQVVKETGCEKVNIIAHSKGGLDSRYAVSKLGMDRYTASLTTISTPHHGCRFVDYACRLPEGLYRLISKLFDRVFRGFGDNHPDFYTATHQFSTTESREFNDLTPDMPSVYYQSYASIMHDCLSDPLLWFPYCLIKPLEGANDGLVSVESAKWGTFKKVFISKGHRGISHGDMIDLKREDYKGFDIVECYVQIVSELVKLGF